MAKQSENILNKLTSLKIMLVQNYEHLTQRRRIGCRATSVKKTATRSKKMKVDPRVRKASVPFVRER